ncbi:V-type proton ATPase subunit C [Psidium guajava]|nr:V-type proton ATPase subunit C [Psidium guajava]
MVLIEFTDVVGMVKKKDRNNIKIKKKQVHFLLFTVGYLLQP